MSMAVAAKLVTSPLLKSALKILLPVVHDVLGGGRAADKIVSRIQLKALDIDGKQIVAQQQVLKAELEGNWLQRNWRPIAMMVFLFILVFQTIVVPIIGIWYPLALKQDAQLIYEVIQTIKWGIGGYIGSRGVEKTAKIIMEGRQEPRSIVTEAGDGIRLRRVPDNADIETAPFMRPDR